VIQPNTFLMGSTAIGAGCEVGPSVTILDSRVGDRSTVTFAVAAPRVIFSTRPGNLLRALILIGLSWTLD